MEETAATPSAKAVPDAPSIARAVAQFAITGLVVLGLFLVGSVLVFRSFGRSEALRDARQYAVIAGQGIVEPVLRNGVLRSDPATLQRLDRLVQERVLGDRVVRVKIWSAQGRVLYSDEPRLIGDTFPLEDSKLAVLRTGSVRAERSDLSGAENRFERGAGSLYEVYLPIRAPNGTPVLFETYQRGASVAQTGRRIWLPFAGLLLASLFLLWLVQVPLAWRLARRLRRSHEEREALLIRTVEASADERRRIAAELHDGVVQDLAGLSYTLDAAADEPDTQLSPSARSIFRDAAGRTRDTMRRIRSLLVDIHPPNLHAAGLEAALRDLVSPLRSRGIDVALDVDPELVLTNERELLVYRSAGEAIRNAERHARATRISVRLSQRDGWGRLEIVDDGIGFNEHDRERSRAEGHVGLSLLEEIAPREGGVVEVCSTPGEGTSFVLEVPAA